MMFSSEPKRRSDDECPNSYFCNAHEFNTAELNKHRGYWKFVLTFASLFILMLVSFGAWQVQQTQAMRATVSSLDKTVSALTAVSASYHKDMERRISRNDERITEWIYRGGFQHDASPED